MFQKLYRHLEEISASLKKDNGSATANEIRNKTLEQLELLNASVRSQEEKVLSAQRKMVRTACFFLGMLIICNAALMLFLTQKNPAATAIPSSQPSFAADAQRQNAHVQENILKLDTLITGQARSLSELKNLNAIVVVTLRRIKKHFADTDNRLATGARGADSLGLTSHDHGPDSTRTMTTRLLDSAPKLP